MFYIYARLQSFYWSIDFTRVFKNKAYGKKYNVVLHLQTEGLAYDETYNFELQVVVVKRITKVDYQRPDTKNDYKTKHLLHKFNKKIIIR